MPSRLPRALLLAPILTVALLAPSAAHASDRGLQRTVIREENKTIPVANAFVEADSTYGHDPVGKPDDVLAKLGTFRHRLQAFKNAVTPIHTESVDSAVGKKGILTAVRESDLGLARYRKALKRVQDGTASRSAVVKDLRAAFKRLNEAAKDEAAALKKLHIVGVKQK